MTSPDIFFNVLEAASKTTIIEWGAFITAMLYVYLASQERASCWFFGIISSILTAYVFFGAKLYYESFLNVFYVFAGVYGWYQWVKKGESGERMQILTYSLKRLLPILFVGLVGSVILGFISFSFTESPRPFVDAAIASFSVIATWMTAKKIIENWVFWIILDLAGVILYFYTGLYLFFVLYFVYTALAVYGYREWRKTIVLAGK